MEDRRKFERRHSPTNGTIRFTDAEASSARCMVGDISIAGAGLTVADTRGLPSEFELKLEGEPTRSCFVRWRTRIRLGVTFLSRNAARISN